MVATMHESADAINSECGYHLGIIGWDSMWHCAWVAHGLVIPTQQYIWWTCGRLWCIFRLDVPMGTGYHLGVTGWSGGWDNRGPQKNVYKAACISKQIILPLFSIYAHIFGLLQNLSLDESIIVTLEYMPLKGVKLLDCLSDLQEPLIYWIFSEIPSGTSSIRLIAVLSASMCMGSLFVFLPFVRRESHWKPNTDSEEATLEVKPLSTLYEKSFLHSYTQKHTYIWWPLQGWSSSSRKTKTSTK